MHPSIKREIADRYQAALRSQSAGQFDAAEAGYRHVLKLKSDVPEPYFQLGQIYRKRGDLRSAIENYLIALKYKPAEHAIWVPLSESIGKLADPKIAKDVLALAAKSRLDPELNSGVRELLLMAKKSTPAIADINQLISLKKFDEALEVAIAAISDDPTDARLERLAAQALGEMGQTDLAVEHLNSAIRKDPNAPGPRVDLSSILHHRGDFESAGEHLRKVYENDNSDGYTARLYCMGRKVSSDDDLIPKMKKAFRDKKVPAKSRMLLGFALAKALEDMGQYGQVFEYLNFANEVFRKNNPYDINDRLNELKALKNSYSQTDFNRGLTDVKLSEIAPIFITGMPRSGTTLVEQIISAHPDVVAGGETTIAVKTTYRMLLRKNGNVRFLHNIPDTEVAEVGHSYEEQLRNVVDFDRFVTDKSIQTVVVMGVIKLALPNARFIVVRRDPRDNLLSIYKNSFGDGTHLYSNDMKDLARFYRSFVNIVDFWREKIPESFHEIWYDDLVTNPEEETRKLIAAAGLEWDDACLSPHKNKREVKTLSVQQVRQPINTGSKQAWKRYENDLQPLIKELGDLIDDAPR